jgi:lipopolysaccharide export system protein LptA
MKTMLAGLFAAGLVTVAGLGEGAISTKGMSNPNAPIDLSANESSFDQKSGLLVYTGNVIVKQGEVKLRANVMRAKLNNSKPSLIYADGRVVIDAPSGVATGDKGVYDVNPRIVTLTGHVVLTKDKNVMRGEQLTVNLITGKATFGSEGGKPGRVQALFTPKDDGGSQKP